MSQSSLPLDGQSESLTVAFSRYSDRLRRMVQFRMDGRLRGRVDACDVVQDALLEAATRFEKRDRSMSMFLWLRFLTLQKLVELHRVHLQVQSRAASREIPLNDLMPVGSSNAWADFLAGDSSTPSSRAARLEVRGKLVTALRQLDPVSREVLALRHFEQLTGAETARTLGISISAQSKRYIRALAKIKKALVAVEPR